MDDIKENKIKHTYTIVIEANTDASEVVVVELSRLFRYSNIIDIKINKGN